jgi:hypothetical protein
VTAVKVSKSAAAVNQAAQAGSKVEQFATIFAALGKVTGENFQRDDLPDGASHKVALCIIARVDGGDLYRQEFSADVNVGHGSVRASSTGAPQADVIAWILGHVNAATRESILAKLPEVFEAAGGELPVSDRDAEAAESMLKRLRAKKSQQVRGSVSVKTATAAVPLSLVG